ncbi:MAG: hypothetical protein ACXQTV_02700 [Candidatus Hecatellaceae archaeon]
MAVEGFAYKLSETTPSQIVNLLAQAPNHTSLHFIDAEHRPIPLEAYLTILKACKRRGFRAVLTVQLLRPEGIQTVENFLQAVSGLERWAGLALVPGVVNHYFKLESSNLAGLWRERIFQVLPRLSQKGLPVFLGGSGRKMVEANVEAWRKFSWVKLYALQGLHEKYAEAGEALYVYLPLTVCQSLGEAARIYANYIARRLKTAADHFLKELEKSHVALQLAERFIAYAPPGRIAETLQKFKDRMVVKVSGLAEPAEVYLQVFQELKLSFHKDSG